LTPNQTQVYRIRTMPTTPNPSAATVVVVSDYAAGGPEGWRDIRRVLRALSHQQIDEPFDILLCESEQFRADFPPDLPSLAPRVSVRFFEDYASYAVKNAGVAAAKSEFVAVLDADCVPQPHWLANMLAAIRADPKVGVVSGRTVYPGETFAIRACALLGRSYIDPGAPGPARFVAINNSIFRREAFLACPLPEGLGTFSSRIQSEALQRGGWTLLFDPDCEVVHDFEGWSMEADFRRNCGHGTIRTRLEDPSLPYARLARMGSISILPILTGKILDSWRDCIRCGRQYGLRAFQVPAAMLLSVGLHLLEIPGMLQAYRRTGLRTSNFR
jgi:glycosyl transferase family 2